MSAAKQQIDSAEPAAPKIWVTGASSGIGAALARQLLEEGCELVVSARSLTGLEPLLEAFPGRCQALVVDLADPEQLEQAAYTLNGLVSSLDVLVINAGTCEYVDVQAFSAQPFEAVMAINIGGAARSLELALPLLRRATGRAHIVGVSSMATLLPMPRSEAYGASKAALEYLLNSLRVDLAPEGIDVSIVRPGFVKTPLTDRNDFAMPFMVTPERAAQAIVKGMRKRKFYIQFPWQLVGIMSLVSWLPLAWQTALLKKISRNQS